MVFHPEIDVSTSKAPSAENHLIEAVFALNPDAAVGPALAIVSEDETHSRRWRRQRYQLAGADVC